MKVSHARKEQVDIVDNKTTLRKRGRKIRTNINIPVSKDLKEVTSNVSRIKKMVMSRRYRQRKRKEEEERATLLKSTLAENGLLTAEVCRLKEIEKESENLKSVVNRYKEMEKDYERLKKDYAALQDLATKNDDTR